MTDSTPEEKLLNLIKKDQSKAKIGNDLRIFAKVNMILIGIIGVVAIIFLVDTFLFKNRSSEELVTDLEVKMPGTQTAAIEDIEANDTIAQLDQDKDRGVKKFSKEEIVGNFNLLGIIRGDNNQAVVEDKALKKTFFLYKGDLLGELKVYDIKESAVILDYEGDRIELKI